MPVFSTVLVCMLVFAVGRIAFAQEKSTSPSAWTVSVVQGNAEFRAGSSAAWRPLFVATKIGPGAQIRTKKSTNLTLVRGGDSITVSPYSLMEVPALSGAGRSDIIQTLGVLLYKIKGAVPDN